MLDYVILESTQPGNAQTLKLFWRHMDFKWFCTDWMRILLTSWNKVSPYTVFRESQNQVTILLYYKIKIWFGHTVQSLLFRKERSFWSPFLFYLGKQPSSSVVTNTNCSISKRETAYSQDYQKCHIWLFTQLAFRLLLRYKSGCFSLYNKPWALSGVSLLKILQTRDDLEWPFHGIWHGFAW